MKRMTLITLAMVLITSATFAQEVNGDLSVINGVKVYRVWGDHYERGFAQGYLMAGEVLEAFDGMMLDFFYTFYARDYEQAHLFYMENYTVEEKYTQEATGVIDGIQAAGGSLYSDNLEREIDATDILAYATTADLVLAPYANTSSLGGNNFCSTLCSWGSATLNDPELSGGMVVLRNMDLPLQNYYSHDLYNLTIHFPEEADELKWAHPSFVPGFISVPSAINEKGFAIFNNDGNVFTNSNLDQLYPTQLVLRNCIEVNDGNGDDSYDLDDFVWLRDLHNYLYTSIVTCVAPDSAIILETNNAGGTQRGVHENTVISGNNLAATNHFRELYSPAACQRYLNIADSLSVDSSMGIQRNWNLMQGAAGNATSIQTMQYSPSTRTLKYAHVGEGQGPSHMNEPAVFNTDFLFSQTPVITASAAIPQGDSLQAYVQISNPLENPVEVWAYLKNSADVILDSVQMMDDGLHADGEANDNKFGFELELLFPRGEYVMESIVNNLDSGYVHSNQSDFSYDGYVSTEKNLMPLSYRLDENFPNPFNPSTTISYELPEMAEVLLTVYDVVGHEVATLVSENQPAGYRSIQWSGKNDLGRQVSAGMYLYVIEANQFTQTRKMLLLK